MASPGDSKLVDKMGKTGTVLRYTAGEASTLLIAKERMLNTPLNPRLWQVSLPSHIVGTTPYRQFKQRVQLMYIPRLLASLRSARAMICYVVLATWYVNSQVKKRRR